MGAAHKSLKSAIHLLVKLGHTGNLVVGGGQERRKGEMQLCRGNAHRSAGPVVEQEVADGVAAAHGERGCVEGARSFLLLAEGAQVVVLAGLADARLKLAARLIQRHAAKPARVGSPLHRHIIIDFLSSYCYYKISSPKD